MTDRSRSQPLRLAGGVVLGAAVAMAGSPPGTAVGQQIAGGGTVHATFTAPPRFKPTL